MMSLYFECKKCRGIWYVFDNLKKWKFQGFSPISSKDEIIQLTCPDCDPTTTKAKIMSLLKKK